jgi:TolB-like protein/DNA-binding winged helix-turn-helix (wHTH) protein/Tfp pilus assembly protein PilF
VRPTDELDSSRVSEPDTSALTPGIVGYRIGDIEVNLGRVIATRQGEVLSLPPLSFDLLIALARAAPNVATLDDLMRQVWPRSVVSPESLSQRIKLLREALGDDSHYPRYIAGVRGRGYRLVVPVEELREPIPQTLSTPRSRAPLALAILMSLVTIAAVVWLVKFRDHPVSVNSNLPSLPPRSIAVLPFRDMSSGQPASDILALGIPEAVLHQLASLDKLDVIARTSSFAFQNRAIDVREIGRRLNARYLLEGSVQRDGEQLRVTAQLIDAQSGEHIWSMRFDKTPQRIFELQDAIALEVTRALKLSLDPVETGDIKAQGSADFAAYLEYLQGSRLLATWRTADVVSAEQHAARAVAIDPKFAAGYVLLGVAKLRAAEYYPGPDRERRFREALRDTRPLIERALALNPKESEAYAARGYINAFFDLAAAEFDYRKALDLNPSNAAAYEGLAAVLYENPARREEALQLIDQARKLDPLEPRLDVAKATFLFYGRGEVGEAETLLISGLRKDPLYQPALLRLAELYWIVGRLAEAIKLSEQVLAADPSATLPRLVLQNLYLDIQDLKAAEAIMRAAPEPNPTLISMMALAAHDFHTAGSEAYRAASLGTIPVVGEPMPIAALRLQARASGEYLRTIDVLAERSQTEWDAAGQPIVRDPSSLYINVVGLADMLIQGRQAVRGRRLLEATLVAMDHEARDFKTGDLWHRQMRPVVLALLGRNEEAIKELQRSAADHLGLQDWWYYAELEPSFAPLRKDARFQTMYAAIRKHAEAERAAVDLLRSSGVVPARR